MKNIDLDRPIPIDLQAPDPNVWKNIPIKVSSKNDELIALDPFSEFSDIYTNAIYAGQRKNSPYYQNPLNGSLITITVARQDAQRLRQAQNFLPQGMYLVALDIYRPLEVQQSLFDKYYHKLQANHPDLSKDQLLSEAQKYVSLPSKDPQKPSPHNTAGSSNVALFRLPEEVDREVREINSRLNHVKRIEWVNRLLFRPKNYGWQEIYELEYRRMILKAHHMQWLNFGTPFDYAGPEAALNYYEILAGNKPLTPQENEILGNRRLLYNVMMAVDFQPYSYEWWHYNAPESQMGAETANLPYATAGAKQLSRQNTEWELIVRGFYQGTAILWKNQGLISEKLGPFDKTSLLVAKTVLKNGDPEFTLAPPACGISPKD